MTREEELCIIIDSLAREIRLDLIHFDSKTVEREKLDSILDKMEQFKKYINEAKTVRHN